MAQKRTDWYECGLLVAIFNSFAKCMLFLIVISEFTNEDKCKFCLALALNRNINTFLNERAHFVKRWQSGDKFSLSHSAPPWICINIYIYIYLNILYIILVICLHILFFLGHILLPIPKTHARVRARAHTHSLSLSFLFSFIFTSLMEKFIVDGKILPTCSTPTCPARVFLILKRWKIGTGHPWSDSTLHRHHL